MNIIIENYTSVCMTQPKCNTQFLVFQNSSLIACSKNEIDWVYYRAPGIVNV